MSATAEKNDTIKPLELVALRHKKIEAWMLEQGDIRCGAVQGREGPGVRIERHFMTLTG
jgi:hypothetical protein